MSSFFLPEKLAATTWSCTGSDFEIDSPDQWVGEMSSSKTSVKLEAPNYDELQVTVQCKKSSNRISGSQIISVFEKQWQSIQKEYPKSTVTQKPEKTSVGQFIAIRYSFRFMNFLNVVIDETTIWFNAQRDETNLISKIEIKGPSKAVRAEGANIEAIIASFRFIAEKEDSPPATDYALATVNQGQTTTNNQSSTNQSSGNETKMVTPKPRAKTPVRTQKSNSSKFVPMQLSARKHINPDSLMSTAVEITDPVKLAQYKSTFQDRNHVRTEEQKAAARKYSGGFSNAQVED
jgi:hypothetical protein